ncbi:MAG: hypothetical protein WAN86_19615, partial [Hyphomicrobiaceae bacterium]
MTSSQSLLLLVALLGVGAGLSQARASPLDADTCNKLTVEHGALEDAGVEQSLAKGPEWAKANLPPERIEQVRRFIELESLIQFRCRSKSRVTLPPDPEDKAKDQAKDQAKAGQDKGAPSKASVEAPKTPAPSKAKGPGPATKAKAKGDPKAQPKALPKKQDSRVPKAKSAAQQPPQQPPKSGTSTRQKRPPKAKVEDAPETAPPPDGNPF